MEKKNEWVMGFLEEKGLVGLNRPISQDFLFKTIVEEAERRKERGIWKEVEKCIEECSEFTDNGTYIDPNKLDRKIYSHLASLKDKE